MNRALWPATLGYYLEELLEPIAAASIAVSAILHGQRGGARQPAGNPCGQAALRRACDECVSQVAGQRHIDGDERRSCARCTRC